jgi:hypothetical protein
LNKYIRYVPVEIAPFIEVRTVKNTLKDLRELQTTYMKTFRDLGIRDISRVDIKNNRVSFDIAEKDALNYSNALKDKNIVIPENVKVNFVSALPVPESEKYGGLPLFDVSTGFSVRTPGGTKYLVTVGHIKGSIQTDPDGYYTLVDPPGYFWYGSYDCELRTPPAGSTITNKIRYWSDGSTLNITSVKSRDSIEIGDIVSKYGKITYYTAGEVTSTEATVDMEEGESNPTFIEVYNTFSYTYLSRPGDCGGPWFSGNTAWGIHTTGGYNGMQAWFMSQSYLYPSLGVNVMTSP